MEQKQVRIKKWLPIVFMVLGVLGIALAASADLIGIGRVSTWGGKQTFAVLVGLAILVIGALFTLPIGQRFIQELFVLPVESQRPVSELQIAIWFGLVTGSVEVSILVFRKVFQGVWVNMSANFAWMVLLSDISVFFILGLALMLIAKRLPRFVSLRVRIVVLTFLGLMNLLLLFPEVHLIASLILSIGLATQVASFIMKHLGRYYWAVRWTTPVLFAILILLLNATLGWLTVTEWRASGEFPFTGLNDPDAFPFILDTMLIGGFGFQIVRLVRSRLMRNGRKRVDALANDSATVNKQETSQEPSMPNAQLTRREFLVGASVGAVVGVGSSLVATQAWEMFAQQRTLEKISRGTIDSPNVLLIVLDTVRAKSLELHGYNQPTTPQLERLAKNGVTFQWAFSPSSWTLPSHGTMFTGRWHHEQSVGWYIPLDGSLPTLAEVLKGKGYATAGFVGNNLFCTYEGGLNRGFAHYEDYMVSPDQVLVSSSFSKTLLNDYNLRRAIGYYELSDRKSAEQVNRAFLQWLGSHQDRPFFAFLNYFDAHSPYLPPKPFDSMFGPISPRRNPWMWPNWEWTAEDRQIEKNAYDGAIAYIDHQIGMLCDELERQDVLKNTLVILVSDHGEQFGEHKLMAHANSLYLQTLHVPLMILYPPQVPAGKRVSAPISLRDLPATILDLVGHSSPLPGLSLARYWENGNGANQPGTEPILSEVNYSPKEKPDVPTSRGDMKSLVIDHYHYILNGDRREEVYDFDQDPEETLDLVASGKAGAMLSRFRESITQVLAQSVRSSR